MKSDRYLRGSTKQCPKCGSRTVAVDPGAKVAGYGPGMATCANCKTIWEPFDPEQIWDKSDAHCSFKEPCNNCAFRPGSNEQRDRAQWKTMIGQLKKGGQFYCHKGVPITSDAKYGFAYPTKTVRSDIAGPAAPHEVEDIRKMRLCRGYLNALRGIWKAMAKEAAE